MGCVAFEKPCALCQRQAEGLLRAARRAVAGLATSGVAMPLDPSKLREWLAAQSAVLGRKPTPCLD
eukprot:6231253-Alexandrium_andersonii.AAC.1